MEKIITFILIVVSCSFLFGCDIPQSAEKKDNEAVNRQQEQYSARQPIPAFDWSLERHLVTQLYQLRNRKVATHSVWRSDMGMVEGDCTSMGFGIPYDTSLTNPLQKVYGGNGNVTTIEQAEPNGLFSSKATSATWVMCIGDGGAIEPIYVESHVTVYPYPVKVDYTTNRVTKSGMASSTITANQ